MDNLTRSGPRDGGTVAFRSSDELLAAAQKLHEDSRFMIMPSSVVKAIALLESCAALVQQREREVTDANGLLPCPFCGFSAEIRGLPERTWHAQCKTCYAEVIAGNREDAIKRWNRRAVWPAADKDTKRLNFIERKFFEGKWGGNISRPDTAWSIQSAWRHAVHPMFGPNNFREAIDRAIAAEQKESGK
jgi:Lar family restriction alleviation protein